MSTENTAVEVWDRSQGSDSVVAFGRDIDMRYRLAVGIAKSGMTHHKTPEAVMTIALTAFEMGLPLMQALRGMYVVKGKIGIEGHLMDALAIQRCGVTKTIRKSDRRACHLTLHRTGWDSVESAFTLEDAKLAGLVKSYDDNSVTPVQRDGKPQMTWVQHTEEMLYWRALSKGLKRIAPDYFGGVYHLDELQDAGTMAEQAGRVSTNAELDALKNGVEPDLDILTDDEQERLWREFDEAELAGVDVKERRADASALLDAGNWGELREAWDALRADVLETLPAQTPLV